MTPELSGLIATLRRGSLRWLAFTVDRIRTVYALPPGENRATPIGMAAPVRQGAREKEALPDRPDESSGVGSLERAQKARRGPTLRSRSQAQSPGLIARPVSMAVPVGGTRRVPNTSAISVGDRALDDDVESSTHRHRRRALEEINSVSSNSPSSGLPPLLRTSGEGTSQVDPSAHLPDVHEISSWRFSYDNEATEASNEYGALMERRLADFPSKEECEVEIEGLKGKLAAAETEKIAVQNDLDSMKEKHRREIEGRDAAARKERNLARRSLAREYDAEVRARIEALTEYNEGGFELEEELERLRDQEISPDVDYGLASVSDPSLSHLELPEISGDSVD
ncbi:hypothetical protein HID58_087478 [Brassica napus]|uniref:GTD-binding domain-containing protein n=1 Tax=Brassica napus TaxID=3708 RepID=A0ABQ7XTG4_BRANA|nr:hypothetical protein HID58_087478 [Brassica napus]